MSERSHLLFLDLETSGLDPQRDLILEIGALAIDQRYPNEKPIFAKSWSVAVVGADRQRLLDRLALEPKVAGMHTTNGLLGDCIGPDAVALDDAVRMLRDEVEKLVERNTDRMRGIQIAGASPNGVDIPFLRQHAPEFLASISHRCLDVSQLDRELRLCRVPIPNVANTGGSAHRALPDCEYTLAQYRSLRGFLEYEGFQMRQRAEQAPRAGLL